ncbi:MAG: zinc ribbon domain-containing protein [Solirubrobacterales bacterium]
MALAIFGITNSGLNLAASLFLLMLIVLWLALIVYTFLDARRRISDPFLVACATIASFFPYIGTAVYAIVRPPEYLEDAHERELEIRAAELRVRQLKDESCPNCEYPVEKNFLRCPNCERRLKDPCPTCGKPVDPRWALCPYCESTLGGERRRRPQRRPEGDAERRPEGEERRPRRVERDREEGTTEQKRPRRKKATASGPTSRPASNQGKQSPSAPASTTKRDPARGANEAPSNRTEQRSPSREPDPDPRQA